MNRLDIYTVFYGEGIRLYFFEGVYLFRHRGGVYDYKIPFCMRSYRSSIITLSDIL